MAAHHGHEHSHDAPLGETCEVCILAANTDEDFDFEAEPNLDSLDSHIIWWVQLERLALPVPTPAPKLLHGASSIDPAPDPYQRPDAARAPPLYI